MMVKVRDPGMYTQEFLSAFPPVESLLGSLLSACGSMFLQGDVVAVCRGDHLLVVDVSQAGDLSNCGSVTPELVGMDDLWDIIFTQQPGQEGLRRFSIPMPLKEDTLHEPTLVHGLPEPVSNAIDAGPHLVERPPGTPAGFPVAQIFREEVSEVHAPLAEGLVADLDTALVQHFLDISVTERKAVVEPEGMLDDGCWKTMAVGFRVSHGGSDSSQLVKATQPKSACQCPSTFLTY